MRGEQYNMTEEQFLQALYEQVGCHPDKVHYIICNGKYSVHVTYNAGTLFDTEFRYGVRCKRVCTKETKELLHTHKRYECLHCLKEIDCIVKAMRKVINNEIRTTTI